VWNCPEERQPIEPLPKRNRQIKKYRYDPGPDTGMSLACQRYMSWSAEHYEYTAKLNSKSATKSSICTTDNTTEFDPQCTHDSQLRDEIVQYNLGRDLAEANSREGCKVTPAEELAKHNSMQCDAEPRQSRGSVDPAELSRTKAPLPSKDEDHRIAHGNYTDESMEEYKISADKRQPGPASHVNHHQRENDQNEHDAECIPLSITNNCTLTAERKADLHTPYHPLILRNDNEDNTKPDMSSITTAYIEESSTFACEYPPNPKEKWNFNREPDFQVISGPKIQIHHQLSCMTSPEIPDHQTAVGTWDKVGGFKISTFAVKSKIEPSLHEDRPLSIDREQLTTPVGRNTREPPSIQTEDDPTKEQTPNDRKDWRNQRTNETNPENEDRIETAQTTKISDSSKEKNHTTLQSRATKTYRSICNVTPPSEFTAAKASFPSLESIIRAASKLNGELKTIQYELPSSTDRNERMIILMEATPQYPRYITTFVRSKVLEVNNSSDPFDEDNGNTIGVLIHRDHIRSDSSRDNFWALSTQRGRIWNNPRTTTDTMHITQIVLYLQWRSVRTTPHRGVWSATTGMRGDITHIRSAQGTQKCLISDLAREAGHNTPKTAANIDPEDVSEDNEEAVDHHLGKHQGVLAKAMLQEEYCAPAGTTEEKGVTIIYKAITNAIDNENNRETPPQFHPTSTIIVDYCNSEEEEDYLRAIRTKNSSTNAPPHDKQCSSFTPLQRNTPHDVTPLQGIQSDMSGDTRGAQGIQNAISSVRIRAADLTIPSTNMTTSTTTTYAIADERRGVIIALPQRRAPRRPNITRAEVVMKGETTNKLEVVNNNKETPPVREAPTLELRDTTRGSTRIKDATAWQLRSDIWTLLAKSLNPDKTESPRSDNTSMAIVNTGTAHNYEDKIDEAAVVQMVIDTTTDAPMVHSGQEYIINANKQADHVVGLNQTMSGRTKPGQLWNSHPNMTNKDGQYTTAYEEAREAPAPNQETDVVDTLLTTQQGRESRGAKYIKMGIRGATIETRGATIKSTRDAKCTNNLMGVLGREECHKTPQTTIHIDRHTVEDSGEDDGVTDGELCENEPAITENMPDYGYWKGGLENFPVKGITVSRALEEKGDDRERVFNELRQLWEKNVWTPSNTRNLQSKQRRRAFRSSMCVKQKSDAKGKHDELKLRLVAEGGHT
jgi:hypothetical protein